MILQLHAEELIKQAFYYYYYYNETNSVSNLCNANLWKESSGSAVKSMTWAGWRWLLTCSVVAPDKGTLLLLSDL